MPTTYVSHSDLVRSLARRFERDGYRVKADHIAHSNGAPQPVAGRVADIAAFGKGGVILAEAETGETLELLHTRRQWTAFSRAASGPGCYFHVILPRALVGRAQRLAELWGVHVDKWWHI